MRSGRMIGFWLKDIGEEVDDDLLESNARIIETTTRESNFIEHVRCFLWEGGFSPDLLIISGWIVDAWAVSALKRNGQIDYPVFLLANEVTPPFSGFDLMILECLDKIIIKECGPGFKEYLEIGTNNFDFSDVFKKIHLIKELEKVFCKDNRRENLSRIIEGTLEDMEKNKKIAAFTIFV